MKWRFWSQAFEDAASATLDKLRRLVKNFWIWRLLACFSLIYAILEAVKATRCVITRRPLLFYYPKAFSGMEAWASDALDHGMGCVLLLFCAFCIYYMDKNLRKRGTLGKRK